MRVSATIVSRPILLCAPMSLNMGAIVQSLCARLSVANCVFRDHFFLIVPQLDES